MNSITIIKKIFLIIFLFVSSWSTIYSQGLQYRMVSYSSNEQSRASTPFFNIDIFNQEKFTINYLGFSKSFQFFFDLIIGISIATAVILFMVAAFQKITSGGNIKGIQEGSQGMQNAIVGLMIVLSTWLIINTINPDLIRLPMFNGLDNIQIPAGQTAEQNVQLESSPK